MALTTVLLDVDGTLLDSNDAHAAAWQEALEQVGHPVAFDEVRRLIGMGGDNLLERLGLSEDEEPGRSAVGLRKELFARRLPGLEPMPGARALLLRLRAAGLKRIVATSASAEELTPLLERAGVADLIEAATSADDAERSKPDPDIVHAALERARATASECLLLGDTPYDLQAASRAGVGFVAVRSGGWPFDDASVGLGQTTGSTRPVAVYEDAGELVDQWDRSPFSLRP